MGIQIKDTPGYRAIFADPTAWRLWTAAAVSYLGDFVGLGALLLLAYERSGGHVLGPAAVFGVQALPALAVASSLGPWLDRIPRRGGLVTLSLAGAGALSLPLLKGLWPIMLAAAILGGVRTAFNSIRTGTIADAVPRSLRPRLVAATNATNQVCEVFGYLAGSGVAIAIGAGPAIAADAATFVVAAALISGLRLPAPDRPRQRSSPATGLRAIFGDRTLSLLVPIAWVGMSVGAMPQSLATAALAGHNRAWIPAAMASAGAGSAIAATVVGRSALGERVRGQFWYIAGCGLAFMLTAVGLDTHPIVLVAGNFVVGLGTGWIVAAQSTFLLVIPPERMAHAASTMIASLILLEGTGAVVFGSVASAAGIRAAYSLAGAALVAAGLAGVGYARRHPRVLDLGRAPAGSMIPDSIP